MFEIICTALVAAEVGEFLARNLIDPHDFVIIALDRERNLRGLIPDCDGDVPVFGVMDEALAPFYRLRADELLLSLRFW